MNKTEYLLTCLSEEASELIKAVQKAQRFGLNTGNPVSDNFTTNHTDIQDELNDLLAIVDMLNAQGMTNIQISNNHMFDKIKKVENYMKLSRKLGILEDK